MGLKNLALLSLLTPATVDPWTLEGLEVLKALEGFLGSTLSSSLASVNSPQGFLPSLVLRKITPRRSASTSVTSLEGNLLGTRFESQVSSTSFSMLLAATLASRLTGKEGSPFRDLRVVLWVTGSTITTTPPLTRRSCL